MAKTIFQDIRQKDDDLFIANGDFSIVPSDEDHIIDILQAFQGEWKQFLSVGVGIRNYLNSSGREQEISREVRLQLQADGFIVKNPDFKIDESGKLVVAPYAVR